jgi:hypothetical protein
VHGIVRRRGQGPLDLRCRGARAAGASSIGSWWSSSGRSHGARALSLPAALLASLAHQAMSDGVACRRSFVHTLWLRPTRKTFARTSDTPQPLTQTQTSTDAPPRAGLPGKLRRCRGGTPLPLLADAGRGREATREVARRRRKGGAPGRSWL